MRKRGSKLFIEIILMLVVSGVIYLPFITQFGYYNDDWYSMYAARVAGTNAFHEMYSIDRPGRAYVMIPLYQLFQGNPLYYSISAYVLRFLGAVSLLWLLRLIWPGQRRATLLAALLFLIYPGFLSMPNAIDFQSHLVGILLAFVSLGLSIYGYYQPMGWKWMLCWLGAVLAGWGYLSQMEYYLGFEAVRLLLLGLLVYREHPGWKAGLGKVITKWLPYAIVPVGYLFWRIFLFGNERATTDVGLQLGALISAPLTTLYEWGVSFVQSIFNVTLLAWGVPLSQLGFNLDTRNALRGILISLAVTAISLLVLRLLKSSDDPDGRTTDSPWKQEMLMMGLAWVVVGLIAVIMGNRSVAFPVYSRYGLVSAAGAILAVVAAISYISDQRIQMALLGFLFFSAALTHYGNGYQYAQNARSMRQFWWQVAWRVPQFRDGSTLIANYPNSGIREDSFVWGPANHIYYQYQVKPNSVRAGVFAILLDHDAVVKILNREGQVFRKHIIVDTFRNYRNFVILSQPSPASCLHVIDGTRPEYSRSESDAFMIIGDHSEIEHVQLDEEFKTPPQFLFGPEPAHTWCYYYEKADYERQKEDWEAVLSIGEQAFSRGLFPADPIEWMPFLQAYARTGNSKKLQELAPRIVEDPFIARQVCQQLQEITSLSPEMENLIDENYCASQ
jgi:hypothetical protein